MTHNLRSLYRAFLRELPPRPLLKGPRSPLHAQLRAEFEAPSASSASSATSSSSPTPTPAAQSAFHGEQYFAFLQAQRTHTMLLERYNPNLAGDMDDAERIRLTARRVGINLPVEFKDGEGSEGEGGGETK
ncbi:Ras guanyl-nucleotide exchange factor [Sporothrix schenckii 1099-18]|uniref:Ras guanyl-nucleotide exchange factor n=1 Tax=Sporothrix schenckii 1099-18 TaxID=1397361 RepID=A0A0F2M6J3_SPOSC|nr:Ras guanyl-nucleotide exchange factor [Sporothrix schenckii 1099-18]KJR85318.1 Ras guanyl-nucleotide exchange factor [Sporothrix schenckii 1099-18]